MDQFDRGTFRLLLAAFIEEGDLTVRGVAKAIGCSEATLARILAGKTLPSDALMREGGVLFELGIERYSKLTASERSAIMEGLGAAGGGTIGFAVIGTAVESAGVVVGASAAGISSGLAYLGGIVGGGMLAGVGVAAAIPLACGAAGFALIKGVRYLFSEAQLRSQELDARWELAPDTD
jgi:hypothetical protein